jgi:hypothetical protein
MTVEDTGCTGSAPAGEQQQELALPVLLLSVQQEQPALLLLV